jgi:MoxR-like ATPase
MFMEQGNSGSFKKYMHPLEESVLSLATGRIEKPVLEPPKDNLIPMTPRIEEAAPETELLAPVDKLQSVSSLINDCMIFINKHVLGRKDIVRQSFLALITGEHQLIISRTGMAKSLLARQIFACFDGATVFEKQLTKDAMPENLFEAMKKGKMIHNVEGSLVLSHFAFLDEIFDANDMLLRALLSVLNEKQLVNGEQMVSSTLHTAIGAANYIRITEVLEAVLDRFLYKSFIPENKDLYFQYSIDQIYQEHFGKVAAPERRLTLGELSFVKKLVQSKQLEIPGYVLFLKNYILKKYIEETRAVVSDRKDYTISDRKSAKTQDTMRAAAILDGRNEVDERDLDSLYYVICTLGREEEKIRFDKILNATKNYFRQDKTILENMFNAIGIFNVIKKNKSTDALQTDQAFKEVHNKLERVAKSEGSVLMEYFTRLRQKFMSLTRDNFLPETFTLFENLSEMSLKDAKSRETRELISGFREDVFHEKKIALK